MLRREFVLASSAALTVGLAGCETEEGEREQGTSGGSGDTSDSGGSGSGGNTGGNLVELTSHEWYNEGRYSAGVRGRVENVSGEELY
jgi:hypothetical protein